MELTPLVTVQVVTFNSSRYIDKCITSVKNQSYTNIEIIVVDNNSVDSTKDILSTHSQLNLILNKENNGFCGGHNEAFRKGHGEYVLVLNPDVILESDFITNMVNYLQKNPKVGMLSGKIYSMEENLSPTDYIDTVGIGRKIGWRFYDIGQGQLDKGQYNQVKKVFGVCGAAAMYRRAMLHETKLEDEYFDENFFAYKEDVDMSWRASNLMWDAVFLPTAIGYHVRGWKEKSRKSIPCFIRVHSIKNRYLMIIKNENAKGIAKNIFPSLIYDIAIFGYCLLRECKTLRYITSTIKLIPETLVKRKLIALNIQSKISKHTILDRGDTIGHINSHSKL